MRHLILLGLLVSGLSLGSFFEWRTQHQSNGPRTTEIRQEDIGARLKELSRNADTAPADSGIIFGKDAFGKLYPKRTKLDPEKDEVLNLFKSGSQVYTGWVVKRDNYDNPGKIFITRVYWNKSWYYRSEQHELRSDRYITPEGTLKKTGEDWGIRFGEEVLDWSTAKNNPVVETRLFIGETMFRDQYPDTEELLLRASVLFEHGDIVSSAWFLKREDSGITIQRVYWNDTYVVYSEERDFRKNAETTENDTIRYVTDITQRDNWKLIAFGILLPQTLIALLVFGIIESLVFARNDWENNRS